jgi:hypothetical protein
MKRCFIIHPAGDAKAEGVLEDRESNAKFLSGQEEQCGIEIAAACTSFSATS